MQDHGEYTGEEGEVAGRGEMARGGEGGGWRRGLQDKGEIHGDEGEVAGQGGNIREKEKRLEGEGEWTTLQERESEKGKPRIKGERRGRRR